MSNEAKPKNMDDATGLDDLTARLTASADDIGNQVANARAAGNAKQLNRLRSQILAHRKDIDLLLRDLDGQARPQVNDSVLGLTVIHHGEVAECAYFGGVITGTDGPGNVSIEFDICEGAYDAQRYEDAEMCGDRKEYLAAIARHSGQYVTVHAADLKWDESGRHWTLRF
jgi:hypothetical protein